MKRYLLLRGGADRYVPPHCPLSVEITSPHRITLRVSRHFSGLLRPKHTSRFMFMQGTACSARGVNFIIRIVHVPPDFM